MWIFCSKMLWFRQVYVWTLPAIDRHVDIPPYLASTARYVAFVVFLGGRWGPHAHKRLFM